MLGRTMTATTLPVLIGILAASPDPAVAQTVARTGAASASPPALPAAAISSTDDPELADLLGTRAARFAITPATFLEAAILYRESARRRAPGDPGYDLPLLLSARLFTHAGYPAEGITVLEEGAIRALEANRTLFAAEAYLEAGMIAQAHGDEVAAHRLGQRALELATSGVLSREEHEAIVRRVTFEN